MMKNLGKEDVRRKKVFEHEMAANYLRWSMGRHSMAYTHTHTSVNNIRYGKPGFDRQIRDNSYLQALHLYVSLFYSIFISLSKIIFGKYINCSDELLFLML